MGWIWSSKKDTDANLARPVQPAQLTRMERTHSRPNRQLEIQQNAAAEARRLASENLMARRPAVSAALAPAPTPEPVSVEHEDAPIQVSVLQRALPGRFSN